MLKMNVVPGVILHNNKASLNSPGGYDVMYMGNLFIYELWL